MSAKDEREWFKKFYEGTFLVKGWKIRMKEILQSVRPDGKGEIRSSLEILGEKIGREWAKENDVRRIGTPMLQKWGEQLNTAKRDPAGLEKKIREIDAEVDKILS